MRRQTKEVTAADYVRYAATGNPRLRCRLLEANLPLVRQVALSVSRCGVPVEIGDMEAWGVIGLCDALDRFDPAKGVLFATYASTRVRGAILDGIRGTDWVPTIARRRQEVVRRAKSGRELDRPALLIAVGHELAGRTAGMRQWLGAPERVLADGSPPSVDSLSAAVGWNDRGGVEVGDTLPAPGSTDAAEVADWWRWVTAGFSREERLILTLIYRAGLTMEEVGRAVGVGASWVSYQHTALIPRLRDRLAESDLAAA